jgi:hypothetical protein
MANFNKAAPIPRRKYMAQLSLVVNVESRKSQAVFELHLFLGHQNSHPKQPETIDIFRRLYILGMEPTEDFSVNE